MSKFKKSQNVNKEAKFSKGVSTRKFVSKVNQEVDENSSNITNFELCVKSASGLEILSKATNDIIQETGKEIDNLLSLVRTSVSNEDGSLLVNNNGASYNEIDLNSIQEYFKTTSLNKNIDYYNNSVNNNKYKSAVDFLLKKSLPIKSVDKKKKQSSNVNKAVPEIDYIELSVNNKGVVDKFSSRIVFSLPEKQLEEEKIIAFRVFRAKRISLRPEKGGVLFLSRLGADQLENRAFRINDKKNNGQSSILFDYILNSNNVSSSLSLTTKVDEITGNRKTLMPSSSFSEDKFSKNNFNSSADRLNHELINDYIDLNKPVDLDYSVVNDLNFLRNIQLQLPGKAKKINVRENIQTNSLNADVGDNLGNQQIFEYRNTKNSGSFVTLSADNTVIYKNINTVPVEVIKKKVIGKNIEFYIEDKTIEFGSSYSYFVVSVNENLQASQRTKIVTFNVEVNIPPEPIKDISVLWSDPYPVLGIVSNGSKFIEKFEIFRKEVDAQIDITINKQFVSVNGVEGFVNEVVDKSIIKNGFLQIGEVLNDRFTGGTFIDKDALPGKTYLYRIYSVDLFGNKSQEPKEMEFFFREKSTRANNVKTPTILSELDFFTRKIKLRFFSDDNRIVSFILGRKNLTLKEKAFTTPGQPPIIKNGLCNIRGCVDKEGRVLRGRENNWNGYFANKGKEIEFIDVNTKTDHTYQYCVYGVDRYGNRSSCAISKPIFVLRRPMVEKPINLSSSFNGETLVLTWDDGKLDIDSEDLIGNRETLANTFIRSLYQVERKGVGEEVWKQFNLVDTTSLEDKISLGEKIAPSYRPPFLDVDRQYFYRVATFQTGGFVSNYSDELLVNTFRNVSEPINFSIKSCDSKCEPYFVVVNWDIREESGIIDRWVIERAAINNFAAARFNFVNSNTMKQLSFEKLIEVPRESSRSNSRISDDFRITNEGLFSGKYNYVDKNVRFGNTYYYRITSIGLNEGNVSKPTIKGIKITDSIFEEKLNSILTQTFKNKLASKLEPLNINNSLLRGYK